ncbi:MAG TPA: nucleoside-diphosphate kinase [Patescibacteria group bacterium]|nr:nucleoside-diphosphate kinase [Patescibacteria group bacterium]
MGLNEKLRLLQEHDGDIQKYSSIVDILKSPELQHLADEGKITVAMVRPHASDSKLGGTDVDATAKIIQEIKSRQQILFGFSCVFTKEMCLDFYQGSPVENQSRIPPIRTSNAKNRWEEFMDLLTSAPSTVLILYSPNGDAVKRWRDQIGVRYNSESDPTKTIRGKFGLPDNHNNLVHGSDSTKAVKREINFFLHYGGIS